MKLIHIIGRKNSGKTTLVVALIEHFASQGIRVGSVKHTHHRHELDVPGKDSFRHREAGASPVAILSPGMTAVFRPNLSGEAADGYAWIEPLFADCEIVLVEGNSATTSPKIEVWRAAVGNEPMANEDAAILAVISDDEPAVKQPVWTRSDLALLAEQIRGMAGE